jgi:hypothetical protein
MRYQRCMAGTLLVMKLGCVTKLTGEMCAWFETLDIHYTGLFKTILLIGINVLSVGHTPIRAHTIHNLIKGFCDHYECLINNYDAWSISHRSPTD